MSRLSILSAAVVLVSGCHYNPTPVPMSGDRSSIARVAGEWNGTYRGTESGRNGSISFNIRSNADSAFGDVLMEPPPGMANVQPADDPVAHQRHARGPKLLAIKFVDISGGDVEGALEEYVAPDCDCIVSTRFTGRVIGDTIRGGFVTRG